MSVDIDTKNRIVFVGTETTQGVAEALAGTAVLSIQNVNTDIGQANTNIIRFGDHNVTQLTDRRSGLSGDFNWMYSTIAGAPSPLEPVFRMCGMNSDTTVAGKVTYTKARPEQMDTGTIKMFDDISDTEAYLNVLTGARGVLGFDFTAGKPLLFSAPFVGDYHVPTIAPILAPDWGDQETNIGANILSANLENNAIVLDNKSFCLVSAKSSNPLRLKSSRPINTCPTETNLSYADGQLTVVYKMPHIVNDFSPSELHDSQRLVPLKLKSGNVAGKRITLSYDKLQAMKPSENVIDEVLHVTQVFNIESDLVIVED